MSTRHDNDVTLPHADADRVSRLLSELATQEHAHARQTRSAPVRHQCKTTADEANRLARYIVERLYTWGAQ